MNAAFRAWIPAQTYEWELAIRAAIDWVEERGRVESATPILLAASRSTAERDPQLARFAAVHQYLYGRSTKFSGDPGPVLVIEPDQSLLALAVRTAGPHHSVCAVEDAVSPLGEWAERVQAITLTASPLQT